MAYDKVVDSTILDAGLRSIADAIREKAGTSDNLAFPTAMAEAIAAIQAGGGMKTGTFCPAEFTSLRGNNWVVNHSLNAIPKYIFVWKEDLFGITDTRTKNEIYCILSSPEKLLCAYQKGSTSYDSHGSISGVNDWTTDPGLYGKPNISIGNVTEGSFDIGSNTLSVGLNSCNYRWVVTA